MSYGLGLSNVTNLDKDKPASVTQQGAFTVISPSGDFTAMMMDGLPCENVLSTGFYMIGINKQWEYRLLMWLARRFMVRRARFKGMVGT